ncbi:hypothetical protein DSM43519_02434 [Mycobacterium marinum]|nr:hypothetical protein DSM43519_02434 [Mycobacterium marinum]RFZ27889.1 hypothetical protein DSM44344_01648 [Mycobacterium marinum]RFZ34003.1 hypothetical protein NCTC2275_02556 [Mycobacterium marinum]
MRGCFCRLVMRDVTLWWVMATPLGVPVVPEV